MVTETVLPELFVCQGTKIHLKLLKNQATEKVQSKIQRLSWIYMLKKSAICLAPSSQFCFVCVDFIPRYALPTRCRENPQQSEHSPYQFSDTSGKRAFATLPKKVLVLFGLLFGHILNQSLWREKKYIWMGQPWIICPTLEPGGKAGKSVSTENER